MTKADAIEKVRKLRTHAAGGAEAEEARTARRIADELAARYGISEAEIAGATARANAGAAQVDDGASFEDVVNGLFRAGGLGDFFRAAPGAGGSTTFYVGDARVTMKRGGEPVAVDELLGIFEQFFGHRPSSSHGPRAKNATAQVLEDHARHPNRVHMAVNNMRSVCGVGPTFVWTTDRAVAIRSGDPCPHCMETGILDARNPQKRLPRNKLRDARGRWIAG